MSCVDLRPHLVKRGTRSGHRMDRKFRRDSRCRRLPLLMPPMARHGVPMARISAQLAGSTDAVGTATWIGGGDPGWDGSLILSTSARPIPAVTWERNYSDPFDIPVLKWFGPWRASILASAQLEDHREDFDRTRIFEARVTFKPWRHLEIGSVTHGSDMATDVHAVLARSGTCSGE